MEIRKDIFHKIHLRKIKMTIDHETELTIKRAIPLTNWLMRLIVAYILLAIAMVGIVSYSLDYSLSLMDVANWLLPIMGLVLLLEIAFVICSLLLARTGNNAYSRRAATTGVVILIASIWFDVLTTITHSSDLAREGNIFIVMSQRFHFPIWGMYLLGFLAQLGITVISCALWVSFVRHYQIYQRVIWETQPRNLIQFLWVGLGESLRSTKTHPQRKLLVRSYRMLWIIALCLIQPFSRWIYGLEWLGYPVRNILASYIGIGIYLVEEIIMGIIALSFLIWLIYGYYSSREAYKSVETSSNIA
jgi:hypothetical protein